MESCSFRELTLDLDLPAVLLDDSMHDRQSQSRSVILRGKKWVENVGDIFAFDTLAIVAHRHAQDFIAVSIRAADSRNPFVRGTNLSRHRQFAAVIHRVHRIKEEIKEHLFKLIGIRPDCIYFCVPRTH